MLDKNYCNQCFEVYAQAGFPRFSTPLIISFDDVVIEMN